MSERSLIYAASVPQTVRRAPPLPPELRREAILIATVPLLREHGPDVSTRQIAIACGVAEGTLFRVFPDKATLVRAAVAHAFAPEPLVYELGLVAKTLPLEERLLVITELLQERLRNVIELMTAVRLQEPPGGHEHSRHLPGHVRPNHAVILDAIADLLEPDRDQLRHTPAEVARLLRLLTFAGTHMAINDGSPQRHPNVVRQR